MSNKTASYFYALAGAIGGLTGWFLAAWMLDVLRGQHQAVLVLRIVHFSIIGAAIGGALGSRERALLANWIWGVRDGAQAAVFGAVGGLISGLVAVFLFDQLGGFFLGRVIAFLALGALVGAAEGWKWKSSQRAKYGAAGGAVGGVIASGIDFFVRAYSTQSGDALAYTFLGALLGVSISWACTVGSTAVLHVINAPKGKLVGQLLPLGNKGPVDIIGRDPNAEVPIITDAALLKEHARIYSKGREYYIEPLPGDTHREGGIKLNGYPVHSLHRLDEGMQIEAGTTTFQFHTLADAKSKKTGDGRWEPDSDADKEHILYR